MSKYKKILKNFREKYIPPEYNQLEFIANLEEKPQAHSITSRGDGKTFSMLGFLSYLYKKTGTKFCIIAQHYENRKAMINNLLEVNRQMGILNIDKLVMVNMENYLRIDYNGKRMAIIVDLPNAEDLKNYSTQLREYKLFYYDEYLKPEFYTMPDELNNLLTIVSSIDRGEAGESVFNDNDCRIIFTGNPVSISSPFLVNEDEIYHTLQRMEINTITTGSYFTLELRRNDEINAKKSVTKLFKNLQADSNISGEFNFNNHLIVDKPPVNTPKIRLKLPNNDGFFVIWLFDNRYIIHYTSYESGHEYVLRDKDLTANSRLVITSPKSENYLETFARYTSNHVKNLYLDSEARDITLQALKFDSEPYKVEKVVTDKEREIRVKALDALFKNIF